MNQSYKEELMELGMINLEKEKSLEKRQDCCLWLFKGLTCGRRRADCGHHADASNRQNCICHIWAENQLALKSKIRRGKNLFLFQFYYFQDIFMGYLISLYYLFSCFLQGSLYASLITQENASSLSAYLLPGEWWFSLGHCLHISSLRIPWLQSVKSNTLFYLCL